MMRCALPVVPWPSSPSFFLSSSAPVVLIDRALGRCVVVVVARERFLSPFPAPWATDADDVHRPRLLPLPLEPIQLLFRRGQLLFLFLFRSHHVNLLLKLIVRVEKEEKERRDETLK